MTVDEAIICLSDMKIKIAIPKAAVQARLNNEALDMAIEALKCSEIPNSSDTISRQQAVDFVGSMNMCDEISNEACKKLTSYLDELPSIQSERKTGHWILDRSGAYCCDKCMEPCAGYVMMKPRDKFCKMCGAKMEGGEHK